MSTDISKIYVPHYNLEVLINNLYYYSPKHHLDQVFDNTIQIQYHKIIVTIHQIVYHKINRNLSSNRNKINNKNNRIKKKYKKKKSKTHAIHINIIEVLIVMDVEDVVAILVIIQTDNGGLSFGLSLLNNT